MTHTTSTSPRPRGAYVPLLAFALTIVSGGGGCLESDTGDPQLGVVEEKIDMTKCDETVACPKPKDCGRVWNDAGRKPEWGECAAPPEGGCVKVVLGRFNDMKKYLGCPGYVTLNLKVWNEGINDEFIGCLADNQLKPPEGKEFCDPLIHLASPSAGIPDTPNQTRTELCQLDKCGCKVTVATGDVSVGACPKAKAKKGQKKKDRVCATALVAHTEVDTEPVETCVDVWSCSDDCGPGDECVEAADECGCTECAADDTSPECIDADACWDQVEQLHVEVDQVTD